MINIDIELINQQEVFVSIQAGSCTKMFVKQSGDRKKPVERIKAQLQFIGV